MNNDRKIEFEIDGENYYLNTNLPDDYIESLIKYLNRHIEEYPQYARLDRRKRALLASINIINDYWQYRFRSLFRINRIINKIDDFLYYESKENKDR